MRTRTISAAIGLLTALAFASQISLASAAQETKKQKKGKGSQITSSTPAMIQPGGGIQSTKAKAAESSAMKKGQNCATQGPKIKKVTPDEGKAGEKVTITGERFGQPGCVTMVSFGPGSPGKFTHVDDKTLTVVVPDGKNGLELLTVTAAVGVDSKPFLHK
jgi:hypothetical protein